MKQIAVVFCAALLALSLTLSACGKDAAPSAPPSSDAPRPSTSSQAPEPEPEPEPEPVSLPELQPGRILALGDERLNIVSRPIDDSLATQAELDRWYDLIAAAPVVRLDFCDMHQEESELSVEQEQEIMNALRGAALKLYPPDYKENPSTGGGYHVIAYDGEGTVLFHAVYIGDWFWVQFGGEEANYIFDGEGTTLDDIWSRDW